MKCNVGGIDMTARIVGGVILLGIGAAVPMAIGWQVVLFTIAAIALVTGIVRYCPANKVLGINTCKEKQSGQEHVQHSDQVSRNRG